MKMRSIKLAAFYALCTLLLCACNNYDNMDAGELYVLAQEAVENGKMDKAAELSRAATKKGEVRAQVLLGNVLYDSDPEAAFRHWKSAAQKGEPSAKYNLGFFAYTNQKDEEAAFWISDAASQGDGAAQYLYAVMYKEGRGVEMNFDKAMYWLEKAAAQNHTYALEELLRMESQRKIGAPQI